jgi:4-hydroxy-4-methyl-2-oxoglutarate aldolase
MGTQNAKRASAGILPDHKIGTPPAPIEPAIVDRFAKLGDLTGTISDIQDGDGVNAAIPASTLRPTIAGARVIGRAITVRNVPHPSDPYRAMGDADNRMGELEAMHQASPGDVLVIQGVRGCSNLGGVMSTVAKHFGIVGAVVDGGVRDVDHSRGIDFPVWSRDVSPRTGKWRAITEEVNGTVRIDGVSVRAGDLVVADVTGICVVAPERIAAVLQACETANQKEDAWVKQLEAGATIPEIVKWLFKPRPSADS